MIENNLVISDGQNNASPREHHWSIYLLCFFMVVVFYKNKFFPNKKYEFKKIVNGIDYTYWRVGKIYDTPNGAVRVIKFDYDGMPIVRAYEKLGKPDEITDEGEIFRYYYPDGALKREKIFIYELGDSEEETVLIKEYYRGGIIHFICFYNQERCGFVEEYTQEGYLVDKLFFLDGEFVYPRQSEKIMMM